MRPRLIVLTLVLGLAAWLFAEVLLGGRMFACRDAAHYYYALFRYTSQEWAAGRVPLWNPYENLGTPLAAGGTASVFYPGQLVFALPLGFAWAWRLYVVGHLLLAAGATYALARQWKASVEGAGIAAISYAFSGTVLFQYANVVYLVGAAWLPVALLAAGRMVLEGRIHWALALGVALAIMVLGGDAQGAYHAGLLSAALVFWSATIHRRFSASPGEGGPDSDSPEDRHHDPAGISKSGDESPHSKRLLLLAAGVAAALAAVQILPSWEFARRSDRAAGPMAGTLYELPSAIGRGRLAEWDTGFLCQRFPRGSHLEHVYQFSAGPWRLAEFLWPNCGGRQLPVNRRWFDAIPAEGRVWAPSLYMGVLPFLLALSAMRFRRGDRPDRWLTWMVVFFLLGSFGWHGLGWVIHEIRVAAGGDPAIAWPVGQPFGGVYWLLCAVLPGYATFRYPAKLLVVVALGLSLLAARGWDRLATGENRRFHRWLVGIGVASLGGAAVVGLVLPFWSGWLSGVRASPLYGPLDTTGAAADLIAALIQAAAVCGIAAIVAFRSAKVAVFLGPADHCDATFAERKATIISTPIQNIWRRGRWAGTAALVLVAADLAVANRWMVASAPADAWETTPAVADAIAQHRQRRPGWEPFRVFRRPTWTPSSWKASGSTGRLAESVRWDRDTLAPKYNLEPGVALADVPDSLNLNDYRVFLALARRRPGSGRLDPLPGQDVLNALGAAYLLLDGEQAPMEGERIGRTTAADRLDDVSLWHNSEALPRAWIVHQVETLPPLDSGDPRDVVQRTEEVLYDQDRPRDFRTLAVVETEEELSPEDPSTTLARSASEGERPVTIARSVSEGEPVGPNISVDSRGDPRLRFGLVSETCRVVEYGPQQVEIQATLQRPGLAVLADQFYPGWTVEVETDGGPPRPVPILRTNRVMRGVWLPAGEHRLTYRYRPATFFWSAGISAAAWIALAVAGAVVFVRGQWGGNLLLVATHRDARIRQEDGPAGR